VSNNRPLPRGSTDRGIPLRFNTVAGVLWMTTPDTPNPWQISRTRPLHPVARRPQPPSRPESQGISLQSRPSKSGPYSYRLGWGPRGAVLLACVGPRASTTPPPGSDDQYDGIEYARLPVDYSVFLIALCCNIFQQQRADSACQNSDAVDSSGDRLGGPTPAW